MGMPHLGPKPVRRHRVAVGGPCEAHLVRVRVSVRVRVGVGVGVGVGVRVRARVGFRI